MKFLRAVQRCIRTDKIKYEETRKELNTGLDALMKEIKY
jgi:hypothetical protein